MYTILIPTLRTLCFKGSEFSLHDLSPDMSLLLLLNFGESKLFPESGVLTQPLCSPTSFCGTPGQTAAFNSQHQEKMEEVAPSSLCVGMSGSEGFPNSTWEQLKSPEEQLDVGPVESPVELKQRP